MGAACVPAMRETVPNIAGDSIIALERNQNGSEEFGE